MTTSSLMRALDDFPVIAIVRELASADRALACVDSLLGAGITCIEITTNTAGWQEAVRRASGSEAVVGVGTVTSVDLVLAARDLGAAFIVSPNTDSEVIECALENGIEPIPGAFTATEIAIAVAAGVQLVKLFPAGPVGRGYLTALLGPFASISLIPTGGITPDEAPAWLAAGARAVGLGSQLTVGTPEEIRRRTQHLREACLRPGDSS
jgi:Entner-Doudoroff aldolase